jgi:hypothetical protein
MRRYTVAAVRERLASALDEAEQGVPVIIERKGVRYRLTVEKTASPARRRQPQVEILDQAVDRGDWRWDWTANGVRFRGARGK